MNFAPGLIDDGTRATMSDSTIEARLQRLEDIEAIRQMKARYFWCCDRKDPEGMRACFVDGPMHIDYGVLGTFDRADAVVQIFRDIGCHPHMVEMHHGVNGQVEITGTDSARGRWSLHYFLIDTKTQALTQLGGYYEDGYRRVAGLWKMDATKFVATSTLALKLSEGQITPLFAGGAPPPAAP